MTEKRELYHEWIKRKFSEESERDELDPNRRDPLGYDIQMERQEKNQRQTNKRHLGQV